MSTSARPVPVPDPDDEFFWSHLPGGLELPICEDCGHVWLRPISMCPRCGSQHLRTAHQSGNGNVYSWVVVHRALDPAFSDDVPYTIVTIELDCGARLTGRWLSEYPPKAGLSVQFEPWSCNDVHLPGFRPIPLSIEDR